MTVDLRADLDLAASGEIIDQLFERGGCQVLIGVLEDLHHRGVDTGAEAFDFLPREIAVLREVVRLVVDLVFADLPQFLRTAQHAGRGAADLDVGNPANGLQLEHGVEGGDLEHADIGHVEHVRDILDHRLGHPVVVLLLGAPQQRDDRRGLLARGKFRDGLLGPGQVLRAEGEAVGLNRMKTTDAHRSTSPKTMSREPSTADTSASMWPRQMWSMACRCAKPGARSLQR